MKYRRILFVFCVLYISCVAGNTDDHKKNHHSEEKSHHKTKNQNVHASNRNKKAENRIHSSSHFQHLSIQDKHPGCEVVCNGSRPHSKNIEILFNGDVGLVGYLNQSASAAAIQDYFLNITVVLDGKNGTAVVEDVGRNKFYLIEKSSQSEEVLWQSSKSDFKTFFRKLKSLEKFVKLGAEHGKPLTRGEQLIKAKARVLNLIGYRATEDNYTLTVDLAIQYNKTLRFLFKGQGEFVIHKNVIWFVNVTLAFAELFSCNQGQLQSADLKINLTSVYGVDSGVEALVNLLIQIGNRVDLAQLLRNQLSSPEKLLDVLAKLSGGSTEGLDGIVTVILAVIRAANGRASINDVITLLLDYQPGDDGPDLAKVIDRALDLIESQSKRYNNGEAFKDIVTVLRALNSRNFVYRNINISDIIKLLAARNPVTVVQVFIRIFARFASSEGFTDSLRGILQSLNGTTGSGLLRRLFPGTNLGNILHCIRSILGNIPIIGTIFRNASSIGSSLNISGIIGSIPVVGPSLGNSSSGIVSGIEHAVENFVGPLFGGPGKSEPSGSSTPTPSTGEENSKPPKSGKTENPSTHKGNSKTTTTEKPDSSAETEAHPGENETKPPKKTTKKTSPASDQSESPDASTTKSEENGTKPPKKSTKKTTPTSDQSESPDASTTKSESTKSQTTTTAEATKEPPNSENERVRQIHVRKDVHDHLHESNKKQHVHTRHKQHEKEHHGHLHGSDKKENLHLKHNLQEKNSHHGHLRESNRIENVHYRHKAHEKDSPRHSKIAHEKKHEDHHNNH